jgi:hypothetical protein
MQNPLLRIHPYGLPGGDSEKLRIKKLDIREKAASRAGRGSVEQPLGTILRVIAYRADAMA